MITYTPGPPEAEPKPGLNGKLVATLVIAAALAAWWIGYNTGTDETATSHGVATLQPDQTGTLGNGTTIQILDVREEPELFGRTTVITIHYTAGPNGHQPTYDKPALTTNTETLQPAEGVFITTSKGLDEPLAAGLQKTIKVGYEMPADQLNPAQLSIDGLLFAGNLAGRIGTNG